MYEDATIFSPTCHLPFSHENQPAVVVCEWCVFFFFLIFKECIPGTDERRRGQICLPWRMDPKKWKMREMNHTEVYNAR